MVHATAISQSTLNARSNIQVESQIGSVTNIEASLTNYDAERDSVTILMSIAISFTIFFLALLVFSFIRRYVINRCWKLRPEEAYCFWIWELITTSDQEMEDRCGSDSVVYLAFQRMITWNTICIALLSILIFLPINLSGELNAIDFSATTSDNLPPKSPMLWIHFAFCVVFSGLIYFFIYKLASLAKDVAAAFHTTSPSAYTVLIRWFPRDLVDDRILFEHFDEIYKGQVFDAHAMPEVDFLLRLEEKRDEIKHQQERLATLAAQQRLAEDKANPMLRRDRKLTYMQSVYHFPCSWEQVDELAKNQQLLDGIELYIFEKKQQIVKLRHGTGVACVTFRTVAAARRCVEDFSIGKRPKTQHDTVLHSQEWQLEIAPEPSDIIWANLGVGVWNHRCRTLFLTVWMFVLVCSLIIPVVLFSSVDKLRSSGFAFLTNLPILATLLVYADSLDEMGRHMLFTYLPMMCLVFITSWLMPMMVEYTVKLERHYYRSEAESSKMNKYFFFLLLTVILLPGMTLGWFDTMMSDESSPAFIPDQTDVMHVMGRVILSNSGPFFILFVLQTALVSTAFQLLRFPDFVWRQYQSWYAVTEREIKEAQYVISYFDYSSNYPEVMCIFSIILIYSVAVPLILPFGILYFMLKHNVDKYNMFYVHERKEYQSAQTTTRTVINYVFFSLAAFQVAMSGFFYAQEMKSLSVLMLMMLAGTVAMIIYRSLHASLVLFPDDEDYKLVSNEPISDRARGAYVCPSLKF